MRRLLDWFRGRRDDAAPPAVRNKVGGMAWIRGVVHCAGAEVLNNRAVKTVRFADGFWQIEPEQVFRATDAFVYRGFLVLPGDPVTVTCVVDECLEPWKEDGVTREEVTGLFQPGPRVTVIGTESTNDLREERCQGPA